jgi:hypothetical protein
VRLVQQARGGEQRDGREAFVREDVVEFLWAERDPGQVLVDLLPVMSSRVTASAAIRPDSL